MPETGCSRLDSCLSAQLYASRRMNNAGGRIFESQMEETLGEKHPRGLSRYPESVISTFH